MNIMICPKCGNELNQNDTFCIICGEKVSNNIENNSKGLEIGKDKKTNLMRYNNLVNNSENKIKNSL